MAAIYHFTWSIKLMRLFLRHKIHHRVACLHVELARVKTKNRRHKQQHACLVANVFFSFSNEQSSRGEVEWLFTVA